MTQKKFWTNFISYIQTNHAKYRNNYQRKWANELHSCEHEFSKKEIMLRVYQGWSSNQFTVNASEFTAYWLELVNDLVEIWLRFDSDMTQHSFSFSTFFSFINILFIYITFFSCHKHISFESSAVSEHYINRSFCITLLLYS